MKKLLYYMSICGFFVTSIELNAQSKYSLNAYTLKISGTSTMHDWVVKGSNVSANAILETEAGQLKDIKSLIVEINGKDLKSEKNSSKMDDKMYEALKVLVYPTITYKLNRVISLPVESNSFSLSASGTITIGGVSREELLTVQTILSPNGNIVFKGEKKMLMTDYKIKPPKAMLGMLTTGNEVTVSFEIVLQKN